MDQTEKELIAMVLAGQTEAFGPLVAPYRGPLLALVSRLSRDREEALDVVQEALLRAYRSLRRFDASRSFRNWLFQIAANEARDRYRKRARERAAFDEAAGRAPAADNPEAGQDRQEVRAAVLRSLETLSRREREVFVLRDLHELDVRETSRALGLSSVSVRVHLSKARRKLREALRGEFPRREDER